MSKNGPGNLSDILSRATRDVPQPQQAPPPQVPQQQIFIPQTRLPQTRLPQTRQLQTLLPRVPQQTNQHSRLQQVTPPQQGRLHAPAPVIEYVSPNSEQQIQANRNSALMPNFLQIATQPSPFPDKEFGILLKKVLDTSAPCNERIHACLVLNHLPTTMFKSGDETSTATEKRNLLEYTYNTIELFLKSVGIKVGDTFNTQYFEMLVDTIQYDQRAIFFQTNLNLSLGSTVQESEEVSSWDFNECRVHLGISSQIKPPSQPNRFKQFDRVKIHSEDSAIRKCFNNLDNEEIDCLRSSNINITLLLWVNMTDNRPAMFQQQSIWLNTAPGSKQHEVIIILKINPSEMKLDHFSFNIAAPAIQKEKNTFYSPQIQNYYLWIYNHSNLFINYYEQVILHEMGHVLHVVLQPLQFLLVNSKSTKEGRPKADQLV